MVLAPGLIHFGESEEADRLIRRYGYRGTPYVQRLREEGRFEDADMVAAHIMHSSTEGRFTITYATDPEKVSKEEVEGDWLPGIWITGRQPPAMIWNICRTAIIPCRTGRRSMS